MWGPADVPWDLPGSGQDSRPSTRAAGRAPGSPCAADFQPRQEPPPNKRGLKGGGRF